MADESGKAGQRGGRKEQGALGQLVKAETFIQFAIALPLGCLLGWLIGSALDKHFHQHWIGVVGILMGAVGGFLQIFTTASRYLKRGE
jgi:ATP synthase protein I